MCNGEAKQLKTFSVVSDWLTVVSLEEAAEKHLSMLSKRTTKVLFAENQHQHSASAVK